MKRETLEKLGLEKDVIDQIMKENGIDINNAKASLEQIEQERDNYKKQFETATETIKGFADYDEVKGKVSEYENQLAITQQEWQNKYDDLSFNTSLEKAIMASGAKNTKAIMGMLSDQIDNLKTSKNRDTDITAALEGLKTDNEYLFNSKEPITTPVAPTNGGGQPAKPLEAMRAVMGLKNEN